MKRNITVAKNLYQLRLSKDVLNDPGVMFDEGVNFMEATLLAKLATYFKFHFKSHNPNRETYNDILEYLEKEGIIDHTSKIGYLRCLYLKNFWKSDVRYE